MGLTAPRLTRPALTPPQLRSAMFGHWNEQADGHATVNVLTTSAGMKLASGAAASAADVASAGAGTKLATGGAVAAVDAGASGAGEVVGGGSAFVSTWETTNTSTGSSNSDQVTLPLTSAGTYDFNVDWGDGNSDDISAYDDAAVTHTYSAAGEYTITITGTITGWRFNDSGDKLKLLDVSQWGPFNPGSTGGQFFGASNLVGSATDVMDTSAVTDMSYMFRGCSGLTAIDMSNCDMSAVTTLLQMFLNCSGLTTVGADNWSLSSASGANGAQGVFQGCRSLATLDVSSWDVSSVTDMENLFNDCRDLTTLDVSSWDVSSVTNMTNMFYNWDSMVSLDVSSWDVSSVTNMTNMFNSTTLPTSDYDALLIGWEGLTVQNSVSFHGGNSTYTPGGAAETARTNLVNDHSWTITDGGAA